MAIIEALRNFDWKGNWKWVATFVGLGVTILALVIAIAVVASDGENSSDEEDSSDASGSKLVSSSGGYGSGSGSSSGSRPVFRSRRSLETSEEYQKYFVKENNRKRKLHQAGPLELDEKLTEIAIKCAKYYVIELGGVDNSCKYPGDAGATGLALGCPSDKPALTDAKIVSQRFYQPGYKYFDNSQTDGAKYFTAYVWKGAKKIGVGIYKQGGVTVFSVVYSPPVNVEGEFKENVLPKGNASS